LVKAKERHLLKEPVVEWKLRCPKCDNAEFSRREGFHPLGRYKCHKCGKSFFKPIYGAKPTKEYIYMRDRTSWLERRMDHLLKRHGWAPSIEKLCLYITDYVEYENDWEEDYCKEYLKKMIKRRAYRRYAQ